MQRRTVILSLIAVGVLLVLIAAYFVATGLTTQAQAEVPQEHHLFAALDSTMLGKDMDDLRLFCVSTLRNRTEDGKTFCTDFQNVHVYVDEKAQGGTYADIDYHIGQKVYGNGMLGFPHPWGDFITIHVQTERERKQFLDSIAEWQRHLYAPRKAVLTTPLTEHSTE